jgi:hypothetical protein
LRPLTSLDRDASAAAPHRHALLPVPQRCSLSGASMPVNLMVVPPIRSVSAPMA